MNISESTRLGDNLMKCLLLLEELQTKDKSDIFEEYEYFSDSRITGRFSYGTVNPVTFHMIQHEEDERGYYRYLLSIPSIKIEQSDTYESAIEIFKTATEDGYYFKEGVPGEFISVFSVFCRARFFLRSMMLRDAGSVINKITYPVFLPSTVREYSSVFKDTSSLNLTTGLIQFLKKLPNYLMKTENILK
jgi:hypothetical protein